MLGGIRSRLTYANLMATVAVFIALGGGAYAVTKLDRNSVKSKHIVNGQVKARDLAPAPKTKLAGLADTPPGDFLECINGQQPQWMDDNDGTEGEQNGLHERVGYLRDRDGFVHLTGHPARCGGVSGPDDTIFTLLPGYRSKFRLYFTTSSGDRLIVYPSGDVNAPGTQLGDIVFLEGISFRCGPSGQNGCP